MLAQHSILFNAEARKNIICSAHLSIEIPICSSYVTAVIAILRRQLPNSEGPLSSFSLLLFVPSLMSQPTSTGLWD